MFRQDLPLSSITSRQLEITYNAAESCTVSAWAEPSSEIKENESLAKDRGGASALMSHQSLLKGTLTQEIEPSISTEQQQGRKSGLGQPSRCCKLVDIRLRHLHILIPLFYMNLSFSNVETICSPRWASFTCQKEIVIKWLPHTVLHWESQLALSFLVMPHQLLTIVVAPQNCAWTAHDYLQSKLLDLDHMKFTNRHSQTF